MKQQPIDLGAIRAKVGRRGPDGYDDLLAIKTDVSLAFDNVTAYIPEVWALS